MNDSTDIEQNLRKTLSRQHAKDISEYTRKIASRDREVLELKRRLSKVSCTPVTHSGPCMDMHVPVDCGCDRVVMCVCLFAV